VKSYRPVPGKCGTKAGVVWRAGRLRVRVNRRQHAREISHCLSSVQPASTTDRLSAFVRHTTGDHARRSQYYDTLSVGVNYSRRTSVRQSLCTSIYATIA